MYKKYIKRLLDIIISLLGLIILSPVIIIVAILVRVNLGSPIIFKQKRPGKDEKIFTLYKFRSMNNKKDENGNLLPDSERLTRFGKFLRNTSLDELPELVNILRGDMSLVGPRPLVIEYLPYYKEEEKHRHDVRPGLTGLAQVNGRNTLNWDERFELDVEYVNNISFINDLKIFLKTIYKVIKKEDIVVCGTGQVIDFDEYRKNTKGKKFDEIGSDFCLEEKHNKKHNKISYENVVFLDSGRNAIRLILENIRLEEKKVLLPSFTCSTVINPFEEKDYNIDYYDINDKLLVDEKEFESKVNSFKPNIIVVHPYFGNDTIKNIRNYLKTIKNNIYIIEDVTQFLLNDNLDLSTAHFVIGSIRKWCAVPDGAFVKNNTDIKLDVNNLSENTDFVEKQLQAFRKKADYIKSMRPNLKEEYLKLYKDAKKVLSDNNQIHIMSSYTKQLLTYYDFEIIKEKRRKNYNYLLNNLKFKNIDIPLENLSSGETPLYFPILVDKDIRKEFQSFLAKENIYLPIVWPKYEKLNIQSYKSNEIYDKIICIPCDQRYTEKDMERIVVNIKKFFNKEIKNG